MAQGLSWGLGKEKNPGHPLDIRDEPEGNRVVLFGRAEKY